MKAAAALMASSRMWFCALRNDLFYGGASSNEGDLTYYIAVVAFRQDAANSKLKQCHMELECGVLAVDPEASHDAFSLDGIEFVKHISDVITVQEGHSLATVGMTLKMMDSLGCPTWRELNERREAIAQNLIRDQAAALVGQTADQINEHIAREHLGLCWLRGVCKLSLKTVAAVCNVDHRHESLWKLMGCRCRSRCRL